MDAGTELRKLPPGVIYKLSRILEDQQAWKEVMAKVPKNTTQTGDSQIPKYTVEHIMLIEQAAKTQNRSCAEIFLEEWGTSGRKRPDLSFLVYMLGKAELFRAADYITSLLEVPPLERPEVGPSAPVDVSYEKLEKLVVKLFPEEKVNGYHVPVNTDEINRKIDEMSISGGSLPSLATLGRQSLVDNLDIAGSVDDEQNVSREYSRTTASRVLGEQETVPVDHLERQGPLHLETCLTHIDYVPLEELTDHFNENPQTAGGRKLGSGGFGSVYLGILPSQKRVAVKRLNKDAVNAEKQFRNEVESLSKFRHHNLLGLLGYSCDSDMYCVVYEYMSNGSLESRLASKEETDVLQWRTRFRIALGTAHGIQYLHTAFEKPLIHRDIKSANILLDEHLVPKIGDFGLVRLGQQQGNTTTLTTTVLGTSAYMAPEAFRGDISVKLDTFSFGVVLLELLTGLPPYDEDREDNDLVTHVETMCVDTGEIEILLDKRAGDWGKEYVTEIPQVSSLADTFYGIACSCLEDSKVKRPTMPIVVQRLEDILMIIT